MTRKESPPDGSVPGAGHGYFSVIMPVSISARVWSAISTSPSVVVAGEEEWQTLRIKQGAASCVFSVDISYLTGMSSWQAASRVGCFQCIVDSFCLAAAAAAVMSDATALNDDFRCPP